MIASRIRILTTGLLSFWCAAAASPGHAIAQPRDEHGWYRCAAENEFCRTRGHEDVRFGVPGHWVHRRVDNGIPCTNRAFGEDPAPDIVKECQVAHDDHEDRHDYRR